MILALTGSKNFTASPIFYASSITLDIEPDPDNSTKTPLKSSGQESLKTPGNDAQSNRKDVQGLVWGALGVIFSVFTALCLHGRNVIAKAYDQAFRDIHPQALSRSALQGAVSDGFPTTTEGELYFTLLNFVNAGERQVAAVPFEPVSNKAIAPKHDPPGSGRLYVISNGGFNIMNPPAAEFDGSKQVAIPAIISSEDGKITMPGLFGWTYFSVGFRELIQRMRNQEGTFQDSIISALRGDPHTSGGRLRSLLSQDFSGEPVKERLKNSIINP